MPDITFYVLPSESTAERYQFTCKLVEKAYRSGVYVYVLTDSLEQSKLLDDLLWIFRPGSFIPHQLYTDDVPAIENAVLIGSSNPPQQWSKAIINLSSQCPPNFQQAERIIEILDDSEKTKMLGRQRYRHYQQAGLKPIHHDMGQNS